jgi:predicted Zn-dependent protease
VQQYFRDLSERLRSMLRGDELFTCSFSSESSDFVRMSRAAVRQAGSVTQHHLSFDLIEGRRHAAAGLTLSGDRELDDAQLRASVEDLRERRASLPEDPHLLYASEVHSSEALLPGALPSGEDVAGTILDAAGGRDLVGIYAAGEISSGFSNSFGQQNWQASESFNLDYSFHQASKGGADAQAIKGSHAGTHWDGAGLAAKFELADEQLAALGRPAHAPVPGAQRVYLAPAALADIMDMLSWGGFGLRDHRSKTTPLLRLAEGQVTLHPDVSIRENTKDGIAPAFQSQGFLRPDEVVLIDGGQYRDHLVSPRSAAEYAVPTNGASNAEAPLSIDVGGGSLASDDVLRELGTGVYVSNLWYLNFSDRRACRTTGMTRFATFWVENGKIAAPLAAMRFDESVYRMLGGKLAGLTVERELLLDPDTYGQRSSRSQRLPGALIEDFEFTL